MSWSEELHAARRRREQTRSAAEERERWEKKRDKAERTAQTAFRELTSQFLTRARRCPRHSLGFRIFLPYRMWMVDVVAVHEDAESSGYEGIFITGSGDWRRAPIGSEPEAPRWIAYPIYAIDTPTVPWEMGESHVQAVLGEWRRRFADALAYYGYEGD